MVIGHIDREKTNVWARLISMQTDHYRISPVFSCVPSNWNLHYDQGSHWSQFCLFAVPRVDFITVFIHWFSPQHSLLLSIDVPGVITTYVRMCQ